MKKITTLSTLLVIGTLGLWISSWFTPSHTITIDLSEEDSHLYL